ncbi:xanthine dehydrogenase family protein subunit M [Dongia soli]|uniref:Xanthine dehydrogenase family protein subunit M n=1 Tax=Dongia soli TaxID=600628 RepID=A0ABU5E642_9PROT|nr:xanthine dehydrogenase family protein subunit M [Dongia soli]MDY0881636.1 xanthine dehydrogenase family protein subunit M [Dongia soli]
MYPFDYQRIDTQQALSAAQQDQRGQTGKQTSYLAGGTTLLDLMKLGTLAPAVVLDINGLAHDYGDISWSGDELKLGALVRMSAAADHQHVRTDFPVIAQSLELAASPQIRNMASLGGNVLQRTRCNYFRQPGWSACNKRQPGSGCAAIEGVNRKHAILGVSDHCIAAYPGDFAQALIALDASVDILGANGTRTIGFDQLHLTPGTEPERETILLPGELITAFHVPTGPWTKRSLYLKIRDRESYEFALVSAAVAMHLEDNAIKDVRIALGGVATKPWRAREAERQLIGNRPGLPAFEAASKIAFAGAITRPGNRYKAELGQQTLTRALLQLTEMEI